MIRVLVYHTINEVQNFEKQILYLKDNYNFISLEQLYDHVYHRIALPVNPLLITFDDGDYSVYENGLKILRKYKVPAVCFIITSIIGTKIPFWWKEIDYYLGDKEGYRKTREVKKYSNKERISYLKKVRSSSEKTPFQQLQLATKELKEMKTNGIEICNHSHTHPMFDQCTNSEIQTELKESIRFLKDGNFFYSVFAYPNGNSTQKTEKFLKEFNIKLSFLFDHKINNEISNPFRISRLIVNDSTTIPKLRFILSGWHSKVLPLSKKIGKWLK